MEISNVNESHNRRKENLLIQSS